MLAFIMREVDKKLEASTLHQNIERQIILKFLGTAVMGVLESNVLGEVEGDTETIACQVGEMLK